MDGREIKILNLSTLSPCEVTSEATKIPDLWKKKTPTFASLQSHKTQGSNKTYEVFVKVPSSAR